MISKLAIAVSAVGLAALMSYPLVLQAQTPAPTVDSIGPKSTPQQGGDVLARKAAMSASDEQDAMILARQGLMEGIYQYMEDADEWTDRSAGASDAAMLQALTREAAHTALMMPALTTSAGSTFRRWIRSSCRHPSRSRRRGLARRTVRVFCDASVRPFLEPDQPSFVGPRSHPELVREIVEVLGHDVERAVGFSLASAWTALSRPPDMAGAHPKFLGRRQVAAVRGAHHDLLGLEIERFASCEVNLRLRLIPLGDLGTEDCVPREIVAPRYIGHQSNVAIRARRHQEPLVQPRKG